MAKTTQTEIVFNRPLWSMIEGIYESPQFETKKEGKHRSIVTGSYMEPYDKNNETPLRNLNEWKVIKILNPNVKEKHGEKLFLVQTTPQFEKLYHLCKSRLRKT